jgi:TolA-binding protein
MYANDPVWREKADGLRLLILGIEEAKLEDSLEGFHLQTEKVGRQNHWMKWVAAASIVGVAVIGASLLLTGTPEEKLFELYYRPDPGLPTLMGVSDHFQFENAMVSYKTGDYGEAIDHWQELLKEHPGNDTLNYFLGSAYLADGKVPLAIKSLDRVSEVPESVFLSDAYWYLALGKLKLNKKEEAIEALRLSGHPGKERLLSELER